MKTFRPFLSRGFDLGARLAFGAVILLLPFTSIPLLSRAMGNTTVAPASGVFVLLLVVVWMPVFLLRGGRLPAEMRPFLIFVGVALAASAAAFFLPLPAYKGFTVVKAETKALITLVIGVATYVVIALWPRQSSHFQWILLLVNISGLIILAWSAYQLYYILFKDGNYSVLIVKLQRLVSSRSLLDVGFRTRVGGFTYEPSWLAHQLNVLYIPYWLAATVTGYSATKKFLHLSAENVLLAGGIVVMYFTVSRVGELALLLVLAYLFYRLNVRGIAWLQKVIRPRLAGAARLRNLHPERWLLALLILALLVVYAGLGAGLLLVLPHINPRLGSLLSLNSIPTNLFDFSVQINIAERIVYWTIGWDVFGRYPLLGVGLGNTGFFFQQMLPNVGYRLNEVMTLVNNAGDLPNIKSFWLRILAETGLAGFSLFVAWQYLLWQAGKFLRANRSLILRTLGWMGAFALIAFLAEGFSIDSFALPYLWVSTGLLTAASAFARREAAPASGASDG